MPPLDGSPHARSRKRAWEIARGGVHTGAHLLRSSISALRDSFTALDKDHSGHLCVEEILSASNLIGLTFDKHELARDLLLADADADGAFEVHEFDKLLRQQLQMAEAGIEENDRPLVLQILPLVARSNDAHHTVHRCMEESRSRVAEIELRHESTEGLQPLARASTMTQVLGRRRDASSMSLPSIEPRNRRRGAIRFSPEALHPAGTPSSSFKMREAVPLEPVPVMALERLVENQRARCSSSQPSVGRRHLSALGEEAHSGYSAILPSGHMLNQLRMRNAISQECIAISEHMSAPRMYRRCAQPSNSTGTMSMGQRRMEQDRMPPSKATEDVTCLIGPSRSKSHLPLSTRIASRARTPWS
jgi:hypothetical protein